MASIEHSDSSFILRKYINARRGYRPYLEAALELASFLYDNNAKEKDSTLVDVLSRNQYVPGILSGAEESILMMNFEDAVEDLCYEVGHGWDISLEAMQPYEITEFAVSLLKLEAGARIYNPFAGFGSYAIAAPQYRFDGEELNRTVWALMKIRLLANGVEADYSLGDSFKRIPNIGEGCFDGAIMTPPFIDKLHNEIETASQILDGLKNGGRLVMVEQASVLFRRFGKEEGIRRRLVAGGHVESVILLPDNLFPGMSVICAVIVLSNNCNHTIRMVDASDAFDTTDRRNKLFNEQKLMESIADVSRDVPKEEVEKNGCNLFPKRYLLNLDESIPYIRLKDICEIHKAVPVSKELRSKLGGFVSLTGFSKDFPTSSLRKDATEVKGSLQKGLVIEEPVILFPVLSSSSRSIGYVDDRTGLPLLIRSESHFAISLKDSGISFQYLMLQLQSEYVAKQVSVFAVGSTWMARISEKDFMDFRIPIVPAENQEKLVREAVEGVLSDVERARADEAEKYRRGVHVRKHALEQTVSALSSRWNKLANFMKGRKADPEENEKLGELMSMVIPGVNRMTVSEQLEAIGNLITLASRQVENLAEVKMKVKKVDTFNAADFIEDYLLRYRSNLYVPVTEFTDRKDCSVKFPKSVLEQIFSDIISNAAEHGFHNTESPDNRMRFRCFREDSLVILEIANNGAPLKGGVEAEDVFTPNFSTLLNTRGHSGTGATEVRSLMEQFGGRAEAYSAPEAEYKFALRLIFNNDEPYE